MKQYIINLLFVKTIHFNVCNRKKIQLMYEYVKYYTSDVQGNKLLHYLSFTYHFLPLAE